MSVTHCSVQMRLSHGGFAAVAFVPLKVNALGTCCFWRCYVRAGMKGEMKVWRTVSAGVMVALLPGNAFQA